MSTFEEWHVKEYGYLDVPTNPGDSLELRQRYERQVARKKGWDAAQAELDKPSPCGVAEHTRATWRVPLPYQSWPPYCMRCSEVNRARAEEVKKARAELDKPSL